jgi:hypothetical protein
MEPGLERLLVDGHCYWKYKYDKHKRADAVGFSSPLPRHFPPCKGDEEDEETTTTTTTTTTTIITITISNIDDNNNNNNHNNNNNNHNNNALQLKDPHYVDNPVDHYQVLFIVFDHTIHKHRFRGYFR